MGHAGFYRRFVKDFSKVPKPLCSLLEHDKPFHFDKDYLQAFGELRKALITAPVTFQRCMMSIFSNIVEKTLKVFMDNFSIFGETYTDCLHNLEEVLKRCEMTNLVLNWEKCHFMVQEGIVLGHKISKKGIEVDKAKI